ncbi:small ribosomal subunit protein uS7 [Candidatus Vidania fulgoroideorum]
MSRKIKNNNKIFSRRIFYDLKYNNYYVSKFINIIMLSGKKSTAEKVIYNSFNLIKQNYNLNPLIIFEKALFLARPLVELKKKKVGGATYLIPIKIGKKKSLFKAMKFLKICTLQRKEHIFYISLFKEIIETYNEDSRTIKMRDDVHKNAELNRAFSHFAF